MAEEPTRKLAVLLHADVVGSTALVQLNETLAHQRIQDTFDDSLKPSPLMAALRMRFEVMRLSRSFESIGMQ